MRNVHFDLFILVLALLSIFILPPITLAAQWSYPLESFPERQSLKKFGQLITPEFYLDQESLFPNKFLGYHAGMDLEIFTDELNKKVPVFAVSEGTILYYGNVQGYGGVILEHISDQNLIVLIGHLNLHDINLGVEDQVKSGQKIAYLGDAFSTDSGGERKHLHLGIYKGTDIYFKGYETDKNILNSKWLNPDAFLKDKINKNIPETQSAVSNISQTTSPKTPPDFFYINLSRLINFIHHFFSLIFNK